MAAAGIDCAKGVYRLLSPSPLIRHVSKEHAAVKILDCLLLLKPCVTWYTWHSDF
jgi:hypothetical protein